MSGRCFGCKSDQLSAEGKDECNRTHSFKLYWAAQQKNFTEDVKDKEGTGDPWTSVRIQLSQSQLSCRESWSLSWPYGSAGDADVCFVTCLLKHTWQQTEQQMMDVDKHAEQRRFPENISLVLCLFLLSCFHLMSRWAFRGTTSISWRENKRPPEPKVTHRPTPTNKQTNKQPNVWVETQHLTAISDPNTLIGSIYLSTLFKHKKTLYLFWSLSAP